MHAVLPKNIFSISVFSYFPYIFKFFVFQMLENQEKWAENTLFNATSILTSKCYEELMGKLVVDRKQKIHDSFGDTKQRLNDTKDSSLGHTRWLSATSRYSRTMVLHFAPE